jgi:hypothetical protein
MEGGAQQSALLPLGLRHQQKIVNVATHQPLRVVPLLKRQ